MRSILFIFVASIFNYGRGCCEVDFRLSFYSSDKQCEQLCYNNILCYGYRFMVDTAECVACKRIGTNWSIDAQCRRISAYRGGCRDSSCLACVENIDSVLSNFRNYENHDLYFSTSCIYYIPSTTVVFSNVTTHTLELNYNNKRIHGSASFPKLDIILNANNIQISSLHLGNGQITLGQSDVQNIYLTNITSTAYNALIFAPSGRKLFPVVQNISMHYLAGEKGGIAIGGIDTTNPITIECDGSREQRVITQDNIFTTTLLSTNTCLVTNLTDIFNVISPGVEIRVFNDGDDGYGSINSILSYIASYVWTINIIILIVIYYDSPQLFGGFIDTTRHY